MTFQELFGDGLCRLLRRWVRIGNQIRNQRPASRRGVRHRGGNSATPRAGLALRPDEGAERGKGVVGYLAGPHQIPESRNHSLGVAATCGGVQVTEERSTPVAEMMSEHIVGFPFWSIADRSVE